MENKIENLKDEVKNIENKIEKEYKKSDLKNKCEHFKCKKIAAFTLVFLLGIVIGFLCAGHRGFNKNNNWDGRREENRGGQNFRQNFRNAPMMQNGQMMQGAGNFGDRQNNLNNNTQDLKQGVNQNAPATNVQFSATSTN